MEPREPCTNSALAPVVAKPSPPARVLIVEDEQIVAVDLAKPEKANWREVIAQGADPISYASMVNNQLVVVFMKDAHIAHVNNGTLLRGSYDSRIDISLVIQFEHPLFEFVVSYFDL